MSIVNIEDHLMLEHGHLVFHVSQGEEDAIRLSEVIPMFHGETSWPDNLARNLGPEVIIIRWIPAFIGLNHFHLNV